MDSFTQFDTAARRIRDLPTDSPTQSKLQKAVYFQATNFLHLHMLPLKSLPKVLRHATPGGHSKPGIGSRQPSALSQIKFNELETASQVSSSEVSQLETEEKELRERLIVLEEQRFFVREMAADANRRRKFDEAAALSQNIEDLTKEIDQIQGQLGQLGEGIRGAYERGMVPTPLATR